MAIPLYNASYRVREAVMSDPNICYSFNKHNRHEFYNLSQVHRYLYTKLADCGDNIIFNKFDDNGNVLEIEIYHQPTINVSGIDDYPYLIRKDEIEKYFTPKYQNQYFRIKNLHRLAGYDDACFEVIKCNVYGCTEIKIFGKNETIKCTSNERYLLSHHEISKLPLMGEINLDGELPPAPERPKTFSIDWLMKCKETLQGEHEAFEKAHQERENERIMAEAEAKLEAEQKEANKEDQNEFFLSNLKVLFSGCSITIGNQRYMISDNILVHVKDNKIEKYNFSKDK